MTIKEIALTAFLGAVAGFPGTYYFAKRQTLLNTQQEQEQAIRKESDAVNQNLEEYTRVIESMQFALRQNNVEKFREEARAYSERESRHEFDLATQPRDSLHPNSLTGEVEVLDGELYLYFTLLDRKPFSTKESEWQKAALEGEERMLDTTVRRAATDSRWHVIDTR